MYNEIAKGLVGVYFLCLCGFVPVEEIQSDLYYQKKYDAAHVFANHMAKLVYLTTADNKPLFQVILSMIGTGATGSNFLFNHHLHSCINFESKHSSQSLREQAQHLEQTLNDLPATSSKKFQKLAQLQQIDRELKRSGQLNDQFIRLMKHKSKQIRTSKSDGKIRSYPDHVYLRVYHELGVQGPNVKLLQDWGITEEDYNRIWRKIDDGEYENNVRRIICGAVSFQAKKATANDIDHHKLGIGPDYIKKKYQNLLQLYNKQRQENKNYDEKVANMLEENMDFLNHYGQQEYNTNTQEIDEKTAGLKEDEINTTIFAHKYLSGNFKDEQHEQEQALLQEEKEEEQQQTKGGDMKEDIKQEETKEEKEEEEISINIGPKPIEIDKIKKLPQHPAKLQQLIRRKERMLIGMTKQYGLKEEEVKKLLELTDGRAVALPPEEFYKFYGSQPIELVNKFMDPNLKENDRESMSSYLKTILDSYKKLSLEKQKIIDPAKHYGSLRSAVNAQHQSAIERVDYTKKKYTDEYFKSIQREFQDYEKKLQTKKEKERIERRQRLDEIKKLEKKKRQRLTTPIKHNRGSRESTENVLSQSESTKLSSLKEHEQIIEENLKIQKENLIIRETNEKILDKFFDAEDKKLQSMNTLQAKEQRIRGPDDNRNEYGMDGFLRRESNKNYGKIVAGQKKDVTTAISEQVMTKAAQRIRRRTMSRKLDYSQQQLLQDPYAPSQTTSPQGGNASLSYDNNNNYMSQRITKLLTDIANTSNISSDLRQEAKSLLSPNLPFNQNQNQIGFKSKSPSPLLSKPDEDDDDNNNNNNNIDDNDNDDDDEELPSTGHGHYKSSSMIIHGTDTQIFDPAVLKDIAEEVPRNDQQESSHDEEDDDLKKELDDEEYDEKDLIRSGHDLPFDDIDVMAKDLSWLETDELVPISHKEMLDPDEISKLKVKQVPDYDVIIGDGIEQRERQAAVDKLEKSYMADAALKKAREKEKEEMQKRLDEQKKLQMEKELEREQAEFDILKQGGIIRQKKTAQELAAELAALTPEQKAERRRLRKERNNYMATKRNPKLLQALDGDVEEETVMVDVEIDDFELIPIEQTQDGKELQSALDNLRETEMKYGGDIEISDDDEDDLKGLSETGPVVDKRQEKIFNMGTKELYEYIISKTGMNDENAAKIIDNGMSGTMIETAIIDGELDVILNDIGFEFSDIAKLVKILQFDGWKTKQSYPVTMNTQNFSKWIEKKVNKKLVEPIINNGIDGKSIALCINDGGDELKNMLKDAGVNDEKQIESLRGQFVLDSNMVTQWSLEDVAKWLKTKLKSVKTIDNVIAIFTNNGVNGDKLLSLLHPTPSKTLTQLGVDQVIQSKIRGKINQLCRQIDNMDETEIMFWIHSIPIKNNQQICQQLYQKGINGKQLSSQKNLKKFLKSQLAKSISDDIIEKLTSLISHVINKNGGFIENYLIQDPNIMEFNENTASSSSQKGGKRLFASEEERIEYENAKQARKLQKQQEKQAKLRDAKRRHSRVQSKIEMGQAMVFKDGKRYMRVYKGKKTVQQAQKIKNFSKKTITLQKAKNEEQAKIRMARKQKYEKRRKEKEENFKRVSGVIDQQLKHGIMEANDLIGIREEEDGDFFSNSDDSELTSSDEQLDNQLMMTHKSRMSSSRVVERLDFLQAESAAEEAKYDGSLSVPSGKKGPGRVTMAGHALEDFVGGNDGKTLFHRRRASSIVQRIVAKSQNDLQNFKMRRGSKRMSRRSLSKSIIGVGGGVGGGGGGGISGIIGDGGRHSRQFSSGHFVSQFFKSATDRQKIEAGMLGEAPLIVYYCDKDEQTEQIREIYQTSVLDTYIDDYSTFDDYIKILSMRLEQAQKKHRTEMDELRRNKEDLVNEVDALRTKKEELIRLIGQERSLFKRELPSLAKAKQDANAAQDQYEGAENVIKDKFNETKLHVMMMMQFRDNHLRKLNEDKTKNSNIKAKIQVIQGEIEELLSHYFTLQNAHNKLEHTVALLSELTTLCHEVNIRKKTEYEREIKDLLAMIERYRCRIRNVDRLIEQYQKEVVELRMLHERRSAEFKKIQKNPTTNRTAATIDYYVAQRKLYEQKAEKQNDTFDDFLTIQQKYKKEIAQKNQQFAHYTKRSQLADEKFKRGVHKKNQIYKECRELSKALNISWKQAEKEYIEKGHVLAQQFNDQYNAMTQFEQDSKPYGYEFIDAPPTTNKQELIQSFDPLIINKTHDQLLEEEKNLNAGQLDRIQEDITSNDINMNEYNKVIASNTFGIDGGSEKIAHQMSVIHRADPNLDVWRAPGVRNMDEHPDNSLQQTFKAVDNTFYQKHKYEPQQLVSIDNDYINEGPSDYDDDDDDDDDEPDNNPSLSKQQSRAKSNKSNASRVRRQSKKKDKEQEDESPLTNPAFATSHSRSVHFKNQSSLENTQPPQ